MASVTTVAANATGCIGVYWESRGYSNIFGPAESAICLHIEPHNSMTAVHGCNAVIDCFSFGWL